MRSDLMGGLCPCDFLDEEFRQAGHTSNEFVGFEGSEAMPA
jgi:hypothetical protein